MATKKKTYTPAPPVPADRQALYEAILQVETGTLSVSEAARRLKMSRLHFQTLRHRARAGLVEGISPRPPGRPARPEREAELEEELARLRKENARMKEHSEIIERMLEVAGGVLRDEIRRSRKKAEDPDDDPGQRLEAVESMIAQRMKAEIAAAVAGSRPSTVRRWRARRRKGEPLRLRRGPAPVQLTPEQEAEIEKRVRELGGLIGADALHRAFDVPRRAAAAVRRRVRTQMERERKAALTRLHVHTPGVVRAIDTVAPRAPFSWPFLLRSADGAVPYTTSILAAEHYDAAAVLEALERDWDENGAPLVQRLDRFSAHLVEQVRDLADARGVLLLISPPYYPRFNGQHERGNRDLRELLEWYPPSWLDAGSHAYHLCSRLNQQWPRRSLDFRTPAELWSARPQLAVDRAALRAEVADRAERLRYVEGVRGGPAGTAERLAIEEALIARGYVSREPGGWC